jgi:hypothetical protein
MTEDKHLPAHADGHGITYYVEWIPPAISDDDAFAITKDDSTMAYENACPYCDSIATVSFRQLPTFIYFFVHCPVCGTVGLIASTGDKAWELWNLIRCDTPFSFAVGDMVHVKHTDVYGAVTSIKGYQAYPPLGLTYITLYYVVTDDPDTVGYYAEGQLEQPLPEDGPQLLENEVGNEVEKDDTDET